MSRRPERTPLDRYLDRICRRLWLVPARERRDTREELRQHLTTLAAHAARTVPAAEAMEDAMKKFGNPKEIGGELSRQHLRRRRWLSALLKTAAGAALTLTVLMVGYSTAMRGRYSRSGSKAFKKSTRPTRATQTRRCLTLTRSLPKTISLTRATFPTPALGTSRTRWTTRTMCTSPTATLCAKT